jgi:copper transport protein
VKRSIVGAAIVVGALLLLAAPASAHATLQSTTPSASQQFAKGSPPAAVTLRFDESVAIPTGAVTVYDGHAKKIAVGRAAHGATDSTVVAKLPRLPDGTYVVTYRVVSQDSHPVQGAFTFGVGAAAGSTVDVNGLLSSQAGSRAVGTTFGVVRALAFLSVLILVGGLVCVSWWWPEVRARRDVGVVLVGAAIGVIVTSLLGVGLQAAYVNGRGFSAIADSSLVRGVAHTHFGKAWLARAAAAVLLLPWVLRRTRTERSALTWVSDAVLGVLLLASVATFAYAGHGDTGRYVALGFVSDVVHVSSAAVWLGGVAILALALREPGYGASRAVARFAKIALPAVAIVVLSGTVQAWRQIETWDALWHTTYARLLLTKVALVVAIVVAASASRDVVRFRVVPALRARVGPGAARRDADPETVHELRDAVWVEVVVAIMVVGITAGLVNAQPAREAAAATPRTYATTLRANGMWFDVAVQPTLPGDDTVLISPRRPNAGIAKVLDLKASLALPGRVAAIPLEFAQLTDGRYVATVQVPLSGKWTLLVRGLRTQVDEASAATTIRFG